MLKVLVRYITLLFKRLVITLLRLMRGLNAMAMSCSSLYVRSDFIFVSMKLHVILVSSLQLDFFIARQYIDARYWYSNSVDLSVRPSVCLSVRHVPVFYGNGLTYCHSLFTARRPNHSRFIKYQTYSRNSDGVTPCWSAKYKCGIKISRFSTNNSLYLANDTRERHSYYGRRIGDCTEAFEWYQFRWHWMTSNPDFKVTIIFNVK